MVEGFLVPEKTTVTAKGDGAGVDISAAQSPGILLTLNNTNVIEQESLDVGIFGTPDGSTCGAKALAAFPQKFYRGQHPLLLDLPQQPAVKVLRAHWEVNRWGRGVETPMFEFNVAVREVPASVLQETSAGTK